MSIDHSDFIARHHRSTVPVRKARMFKRRRVAAMIVFLVAVYVSSALLFAAIFDLGNQFLYAGALALVCASVVMFATKKIFKIKNSSEKELSLLREVLEGSRGARVITDGADNIVYYNHRFYEICESAGEISLSGLAKLFESDDDTMAHFNMLADKAHRGLTDSIELFSRHRDVEAWYRINAQPVSGWAGFIHWRIDDITDRLAMDRAIREEREKLIDFTDNAPVGFFSVDQHGRFVFVNATLARWLGEDIGVLLEKGCLHTYLDQVPEGARPYDIIAEGGQKQMAEVVMKGPGGKVFAASISQAVVNEGGDVVRTRGVVHDLTAEREMWQALKVSEDRFQRFFEEAPLAIAIFNEEGKLEDCNRALAGMLGYDMAEVEGKELEPFIAEDNRVSVMASLKTAESGKNIESMEIDLLGKAGTVTVQLYARQLEGSDNLVLHFIDLSELKALEEQFTQSQKMQAVGQLAGGVAHDFNNLLTAMIGFCDLLLLRHKPGDPSFSDIMQIKQNSNRAANLVRQLLAFSRQQTLRPQVQDVTDILTELSHLVRRLIGANIDLKLVHGSDLGLVKVDTGQMEQVLVNLAVNARDAMDGGGELVIKTSNFENNKPVKLVTDTMPAGNWVKIEVVDTGCGIPEENMSRILEPFFTTKEVGQGTGLGLATVYGIIRQTDGYLQIESKEGSGTTFSIFLPHTAEEEGDASAGAVVEEVARDLTGTARILLVEDEDAVRTFGARALANKGYEVLEADCGERGLEVYEGLGEQKIDLLITDVIMPNMDGPTLAGKIREANPTLKIIFISGYTEEKLKEHMGENIWFLPKPFTLKQLAEKVKEALED